jgi:hypothetical protein
MTLVGYTRGGSPVFFNKTGRNKQGSPNKNPRYKCACGHRTTRKQREVNGNRCFSCKKVFPHLEGLRLAALLIILGSMNK